MSHAIFEFQIKMNNFDRSLSSAIFSFQIKSDQFYRKTCPTQLKKRFIVVVG